ncbi:MAG: hypothetical protein PVF74_09575, partial [Anaerolineales bacterium]
SAIFFMDDTRAWHSFHQHPMPLAADRVSRIAGKCATPTCHVPSISRPISTPKKGLPLRNALVPSIGSMIQR